MTAILWSRTSDSCTQCQTLEANSILKFTHESSNSGRIPLLDVYVDGNGEDYVTSVYKKPTHSGKYLNAHSECPERYKTATVRALVRRIFKI